MRSAERSVRELVADTVVAAIAGKVIPNTATTVNAAMTALGLSRDDLTRAALRHRDGDGIGTVPYTTWLDFKPQNDALRLPAPDIAVPVPEAASPTAAPRVRPDRVSPTGDRELRCAECGQWKTVGQFRPRGEGLFTAHCVACLGGPVPVHATCSPDGLVAGKTVVRVDVDDEGNLIGVVCGACDAPFSEGDTARGGVFLVHDRCP